MPNDNDTFIITMDRGIEPIEKPKPKKEVRKSRILKNVRMDIEELNELEGTKLRKDTRSDIFMGQEIDKYQKESIHKSRKVYVRGHTKTVNGKCIVVKPHLRNK